MEPYLEACLQSVTAQTFADFELILVDDGSTDKSSAIATQLATRDRRVIHLRQENSGPGAARNRGIARARGKYLAFVDSDDRIPRTALQELYESAESNSADVVVAGLRRFDSSRTWTPQWAKQVHSVPRVGITLDTFPALLRNNYPVAKLYRRDFWANQGLAFREGVIYEDQPLIAQILARAARINVLTFAAYDYRAREDRSSISQRPEDLNDLRDRVSAWSLSRDVLLRETSAAIVFGWYLTIYETHIHWYLNNDAVESREYWETLRGSLLDLKSTEPAGIYARISAEKKVAIELLFLDARAELIEFRRQGGYFALKHASSVIGTRVRHHLPVTKSAREQLPDTAFESPITARGLQQGLLNAEFVAELDSFELVLTGYANFPFVDPRSNEHHVELVVRNVLNGCGFTFVAEQTPYRGIQAGAGSTAYDAQSLSYSVRVPAASFGTTFALGECWDFEIRVTLAGQSVTEPLGNMAASIAHNHGSGIVLADGTRLRLAAGANKFASVIVSADKPDYSVNAVRISGRTLSGVVTRNAQERASLIYLFDEVSMRHSTRAELSAQTNQSEFSVELPEQKETRQGIVEPAVTWAVRVETQSGRKVAVAWTPTPAQFDEANMRGGQIQAARSLAGNLKLIEAR